MTFQTLLAQFDLLFLKIILDHFTKLWTIFHHFGPFWTILDNVGYFGPCWTISVLFGKSLWYFGHIHWSFGQKQWYPILDTRISVFRSSSVRTSLSCSCYPLDSKTGWTGELCSKTNLNLKRIFFFCKTNIFKIFRFFEEIKAIVLIFCDLARFFFSQDWAGLESSEWIVYS